MKRTPLLQTPLLLTIFALLTAWHLNIPSVQAQCAQECTPLEMTQMARGGMAAETIQKFCANFGQEASVERNQDLRVAYGGLEGKNWTTHYLDSQRRREKVQFLVDSDQIQIQSSIPGVRYFEVTDLGDAIRFNRSQAGYRAVYTLTIPKESIQGQSLTVQQNYNEVKTFQWYAQ